MTAPPTGGRHREAAGLHRARRRRSLPLGRALLGTAAAVVGLLAVVLPSSSPAAPSTSASQSPAPESVPVSLGEAGEPATAAPTRVRVPAIHVDSPLVRLGVDDAGVLVPPEDFARAGWYAGGPAPGAVGPAVIAGHVDSYEGPAVFFRLSELEPGDEVLVDRADGTTAAFAVTAVERYPKDGFPTERVYGPAARPELRLITCGGTFDRTERSYRDNIVVSAALVA